MNIQSAIFDEDKTTVRVAKLERDYSSSDDAKMIEVKHYVPVDSNNTDYQELMAWVAEGNTISSYVAPTPSPRRTHKQRLEIAVGLTAEEIKTVLGI